jgi:hypothetical protein
MLAGRTADRSARIVGARARVLLAVGAVVAARGDDILIVLHVAV